MMGRLEAGLMEPPVDLVTYARSVYDATDATDQSTPQEASLKLHLISIRDRLRCHVAQSLHWCDARDTLADALTKGGVNRNLLTRALEKGPL